MAKTTTALALAVGLAKKMEEQDGGNVLIIDLDPQGDTARGLGLEPEGQWVSNVLLGNGHVDLLRENVVVREALASAVSRIAAAGDGPVIARKRPAS